MLYQTQDNAQNAAFMFHPRVQSMYALYAMPPGFRFTITTMLIRSHHNGGCTEQGGDDTFGGFPDHLRALVSHALPNISVRAVTYPKFETRGDLHECVARFVEWYVV